VRFPFGLNVMAVSLRCGGANPVRLHVVGVRDTGTTSAVFVPCEAVRSHPFMF
jgi:hypothetical protein